MDTLSQLIGVGKYHSTSMTFSSYLQITIYQLQHIRGNANCDYIGGTSKLQRKVAKTMTFYIIHGNLSAQGDSCHFNNGKHGWIILFLHLCRYNDDEVYISQPLITCAYLPHLHFTKCIRNLYPNKGAQD